MKKKKRFNCLYVTVLSILSRQLDKDLMRVWKKNTIKSCLNMNMTIAFGRQERNFCYLYNDSKVRHKRPILAILNWTQTASLPYITSKNCSKETLVSYSFIAINDTPVCCFLWLRSLKYNPAIQKVELFINGRLMETFNFIYHCGS